MSAPRILIVDDTSFVRKMVRRTLESLGFDFFEAENGIEAEEFLRRYSDISVVILDVDMPLQDGITTLRNLRDTGNQIPVIMLTANKKKEILREAARLGISAFFTKPFQEERFLEKVGLAVESAAPSVKENQSEFAKESDGPFSQKGKPSCPDELSTHFKILIVEPESTFSRDIDLFLEKNIDEVYFEPNLNAARRIQEWISPKLILVNLDQSTQGEVDQFVIEYSAENLPLIPCLVSYRSLSTATGELPCREFKILNYGSIDREKLKQVLENLTELKT